MLDQGAPDLPPRRTSFRPLWQHNASSVSAHPRFSPRFPIFFSLCPAAYTVLGDRRSRRRARPATLALPTGTPGDFEPCPRFPARHGGAGAERQTREEGSRTAHDLTFAIIAFAHGRHSTVSPNLTHDHAEQRAH